MYDIINTLRERIIKQQPLILNITNQVSIEFIANGLLSLGASPVMSNATHEMEQLLAISNALVVNIGTLDNNFVSLCQHACQIANQLNKPIILDPVGAGASNYRTHTALAILSHYQIAIVRGNAGEIMAMAGSPGLSKGVESLSKAQEALASAKELSTQFNCCVVVSGEADLIVDQNEQQQYQFGSTMMPKVTGTGCLLTAITAAFHAVEPNRMLASKAASIYYSLCGEMAAKKAQAPGSFRQHFLDALFNPDDALLKERLNGIV